jgi:hypothetical protein
MLASASGLHDRAKSQADDLLGALAASESVIIATIERECEALRAGRMLAAKALHTHLCDASRLYLDATRAAYACMEATEQVLPGTRAMLDARRKEFSVFLKVELAVLAAERAVAGEAPIGFDVSDPPEAALAERARPRRRVRTAQRHRGAVRSASQSSST